MKTLLLLLTMPLFAHVPCKQWEVIDTTINGKVRQISYCPEWDNKAPCEPLTLVKVRRDTIELTDTIYLQPVAVDCPEVIDRRYDWAAGFVMCGILRVVLEVLQWLFRISFNHQKNQVK